MIVNKLPNDEREIIHMDFTFRPIKGMEGPMIYRIDGVDMVLHYDPAEGEYYDQAKDMYVSGCGCSECRMVDF